MRKDIIIAITAFIVGSIIFFFVGRSTIKMTTEIKYIKGEPISGSVNNDQLEPIKEEKPEKPILPTKEIEVQYRDTGSVKIVSEIKYLYHIVDTAAIIDDYITMRSYNITAFDNAKQGKLSLYPTIQYNKLTGLDYEFTPIQKQTNTYLQKIWQPFVSGSYSTLNYIGLGGGVFYYDLGLEYQYQIGYNGLSNGHSFGLKYKF